MEAFIHLITGFGVLAILFVVFAESGLLFGFIFPGDSLLFTAGAMVQQGILPINIHLFVFLLIIAAIAGDTVGYTFGHKVGRKLFERENSRFFKKKYLQQAEKFYEKHGSLTVVLARFVPIVRTFAPIVAGASKMHYRTFVAYNIIGGIVWATIFTYLGFFAGKALTEAGINIEVAALIIIFLSILPMIIHALKQENTRAAIKRQWEVLAAKTTRRKK
ncbi:MAG: VTT domain-containing protein [Candidatus Saccharibacteria bacterium]|nr:VTT domain-containing protein [Candidatus Saccharibacteria bacterium]